MAKELEELLAPLAGVTPVLSWMRSYTLRVSSGTRSMVSAEINWPTVELLVSTSDVVSFTVTTSLTWPTLRVRLTVLTWSTVTRTFFWTTVSKPLAVALIS
jgi:hypothetical protein